jgi:hypothetical protein
MLLSGDIGETITDLAIYPLEIGDSAPLAEVSFRSSDFPDLETIVGEFLILGSYQIETAIH